MAGIYQDKEYQERRNRIPANPYRSSVTGGRQGCLGDKGDPYPGTYHVDNCNGKLRNQRY